MKKISKLWMLAAILTFCGIMGTMLTSCVEKDNPVTDNGSNMVVDPNDVNLADDSYDIKYSWEAYVSPTVDPELRKAFLEYIEFPVDEPNSETSLVVLNSIHDMEEEDIVDIAINGGTIAIAYPTEEDLEALYLEETTDFIKPEDIEGALLFAVDFTKFSAYIVNVPTGDSEKCGTTVTLNTSDEEAGPWEPNPENTPYAGQSADKHGDMYDHISLFIEELNKQEEAWTEETAEARAITRADTKDAEAADIKKMASMRHLWKSISVPINETYFRDYRFQANCPMAVGYDIYPVHVYEGEQGAGDYYFVNMSASVNNGSVYKGKDAFGTSFFWVYLRWCGGFPTKFYVSSTLINSDNEEVATGVSFPSAGFPRPQTVIKKVDHVEEYSFGLALGVSGGVHGETEVDADAQGDKTGSKSKFGWEVKGHIDANWKWTDRKTWSVADVDLENQSSESTAAWQAVYNHLPEYKWSEQYGFYEGDSRAYRSTTIINGSWIWYIPNTQDDTESKPLRMKVHAETTYNLLKFWSTDASLGRVEWKCSMDDILTCPKQYRYRLAPVVLKNDYKNKFISNIMVYTKDGQPVTSKTQFQNSYPSGSEIKLGDFRCSSELIVKFKMDGKDYYYSTNTYVKPIFKDTVTLYASTDFMVDPDQE